jgi:ribosomal protein S18 acetylase RimI-like enzyme
MIAEVDGQRLGFCSGFPDGTPPGDSALMKAAGVRMVRAFGVMLALLPVMTALQRHAPGEWYLQAIAVTPESRGTGVGSVLFADAIARAKAAGCESLVLDVDVANDRARELYERLGLAVTSTSGRAILAGNARVHRMAVTL